ncbi:hypothetical protein Axi01nite_88010 [Actinoplanes xinjiangensis]|nr:hypothetical protein Axi01nite_88010 [Actinoplanes xinjiangensis]
MTKWPLTAVVGVLLAVAGCTGSGSSPSSPSGVSAPSSAPPAVSSSVPPAASSSSPAVVGRSGEFVRVVRAQLADIAAGRSDADIQAVADTACAGLAAGRSTDEIVDSTRSLGTLDAEATDHATARELIKLAIDTTCFDQRGRVDEF